jgi:hypothetical protein
MKSEMVDKGPSECSIFLTVEIKVTEGIVMAIP